MAKFVGSGFVQDRFPTHVTGLLLRVIFGDIMVDEGFSMDRTSRNEFVKSIFDYLAENFIAPSGLF